ncbi:hypothetical protein GALMADRAFT_240043 [Galerina marginata CBS 339.88]|uniref:Chromatin assembly factor 1 subunit A dimerization domain-containing protein n=1 Tax=Galerina marginata (strain CBS 339.88) TaxID=685588 RepID=A0A067THJ0_GALM3|nr:hypothetical protein GALMADRAFT_240043 [Galerina marginata CBS 339.88]
MSGPELTKAGSQEPSTPADKKQERTRIVELKNGKVYFKQKPISFEKQSETLQEIVKFRSMLEERINMKEQPLSAFPDEHKPLIAKLAHESDKTLTALGKHIHRELLPTLDEDEDKDIASASSAALPLNLVENAILDVLVRNNYGIDVPLGVKPPSAISVWRWEVRAEHIGWLPKNSREKAELRHAERVQAKEDLRLLFEAYSQEERDTIIDPKGTNKLPTKELNKPERSEGSVGPTVDTKETPQSSKKQGKKKAEESENNRTDGKLPALKRPADPEKATKEKEKLEKRAAREEKEKKEKDAHNKSQSIMAKFFSKAKAKSPAKEPESAIAGPSNTHSDFQKVFKPFVLQKDKVMAPSNWFKAEKKRKRRTASTSPNNEIIIIDSDEEVDVEMLDPQPTAEALATMTPRDHLTNILSTLPPSATPRSRQPRRAGFKLYHPISVRDLMSQLSEAEISGNDDLVRTLLAKLGDRELLPAKAFHFHTDARPGYFGTWTRSSRVVGPRRPFAKDTLVFDYGYDSGEEWEEEPAGEDVAEDGEDEDGDADEPDSDLESWLVEDDNEPADLSALSRNSSPPPIFDFPNAPPPPKRKAEDEERKMGKKRKVVVPLVPFAKGPLFESTIGDCQYEPFKPYAIQLFNDTPLSIDPFTFVSTCVEDYKENLRILNSTNHTQTNEVVFAVPALPPRLTAPVNGNAVGFVDYSTRAPVNSVPAPKKAPVVPKASFPDTYMQLLLDKITQLQASSITTLVESIYLELREHKVKKIAIEAKVKEVGEKCKEKRVWVVKPSLLQQQPPATA